MENLNTMILAAGASKRMKSKYSKVFYPFLGQPLVKNIFTTAKSLNPSKIIIVVKEDDSDLAYKTFGNEAIIAIQKEPLGTADAVKNGLSYVDNDADLLILCGDTPLLKAETLKNLVSVSKDNNADVALITAIIREPKQYGRVIRDINKEFLKIVEFKDAKEEEKKINEINSGVYIFKSKKLNETLKSIGNNNASSEFYFTDTLEFIKKQGGKIETLTLLGENEIFGINSKKDLAEALKIAYRENNNYLMEEKGIVIIDPETTYIDKNAQIERDTIIKPFTFIEGNVKIGEDSVIGPFVCIRGGNEGIVIGKKCTIGPFSSIRDGTIVEDEAKIGTYVEVKKTRLGKKSKSMHLAYIGDADIGENVNIGAGTITCNYDGTKKNKTIIKDNAFIGSNTIIVPPLTINKGAYTAAGSTITDDVPEDSLAIGRAKQVNKEEWVKRKREEKKDE